MRVKAKVMVRAEVRMAGKCDGEFGAKSEGRDKTTAAHQFRLQGTSTNKIGAKRGPACVLKPMCPAQASLYRVEEDFPMGSDSHVEST